MSVASGGVIFKGGTASLGFAQGPLVRADQARIGSRAAGSSQEEERALRGALAATNGQISTLAGATGDDAAEILEFQLELLDDESLLKPILAAIAAGAPAHAARSQALSQHGAPYRGAP